MRHLFNWRGLVRLALLAVGMLAVMRAFGDPLEPMDGKEWLAQVLLSLSVAGLCLWRAFATLEKEDSRKPLRKPANQEKTEG